MQDARRGAGLAISDRIDLTLQPATGTDLGPLLEAFGPYLRAETLAERIGVGPPQPEAFVAEAEVDRRPVTVGLARVRPGPARDVAAGAGAGGDESAEHPTVALCGSATVSLPGGPWRTGDDGVRRSSGER